MKKTALSRMISFLSVTTVVVAGSNVAHAQKYRTEKSIIYYSADGFGGLQDEKLRGDIEGSDENIDSMETIDDIQTQSIIDDHIHDATKSTRNREVKPFNPPRQFQGMNGPMGSFWKLLGY